jgi:nicotinamidase/pyrazinamidase
MRLRPSANALHVTTPNAEPAMSSEQDVLIVIDVQNDFCPGGALAVPRGDEVVPIINRTARRYTHVVLTQDWHPRTHLSFVSSHPGRSVFDTIEAEYGSQILWPEHCVQATAGADLHPALAVPHAELILRKGFRRNIDSYSAFFENDRRTPTGLGGYLRERGFRRVFLCGLATDFCVRFSAEDAQALGFETAILLDACRGIDSGGSLAAARESFRERGIREEMAAFA